MEKINWIEVGKVSDIAMLGSRIVKKGNLEIALFRTENDKIYALKNKCAHKGGPLSEGIVHDCYVTCPLHNWVFDLNNGKATGVDKGKVATYPVKVENGIIFLSFEENVKK